MRLLKLLPIQMGGEFQTKRVKQMHKNRLFVRDANQQYSGYMTHLRNSFLDGNDSYPATLHAAYNILLRHESEQTFIQASEDEVAFTNVG
jgi:hypothetical protein